MRKLILSAALVAASVFGMTAVQAAEPVAGKEYICLLYTSDAADE